MCMFTVYVCVHVHVHVHVFFRTVYMYMYTYTKDSDLEPAIVPKPLFGGGGGDLLFRIQEPEKAHYLGTKGTRGIPQTYLKLTWEFPKIRGPTIDATW